MSDTLFAFVLSSCSMALGFILGALFVIGRKR